jgi:homoserine kinase type II
MSVFTPVSVDEARAFVAPYHVGDIIDFQNIAAGVENSNFFVTTTQGRYVLTIFEKIARADLDFYMGLMSHLSAGGVACAAPLTTAEGVVVGTLHGKPAALVTRLAGNDIAHPTPDDCFAVGAALARMHAAAQSFGLHMANWRGLAWWRQYGAELKSHLSADENALISAELGYQSGFDTLGLPRGVIHGDLFRDNILWDDHGTHHTPQMIDFYFACDEQLLFDVAVTVNDWCLDFSAYPAARLNTANTRGLLRGYASVRPFTPAERAAWPQMLRAAIMRTWLGRLGYHHFPRNSELTHPKDHPFSERLLRYHIENTSAHLALIAELK